MKIRKALRHQKSGKGSAKRQGVGRVGAPRQSKESKRRQERGSPFEQGGRITLYGRNPVLEALQNPSLTPQKLFLSERAGGEAIKQIKQLAHSIALPITHLSPIELSRISKNGKQDQGVALDLSAPHHQFLNEALKKEHTDEVIFLLDGLQNPANLGLVLRSLCAAGVAGIILPKRGCAPLNPLAIKASAGVAFKAPIWICDSAEEAAELLIKAGFDLLGLRGRGEASLYERVWVGKTVWVLGNESDGISPEVIPYIKRWVYLPMESGVESLNAAVAGSIVAFELARQRQSKKYEMSTKQSVET